MSFRGIVFRKINIDNIYLFLLLSDVLRNIKSTHTSCVYFVMKINAKDKSIIEDTTPI